MPAADQPEHTPRSRWRKVAIGAQVAIVLTAVTIVGLDVGGRLPGGLVDEPAATPTPSASPTPARAAAPAVLEPAGPAGRGPVPLGRLRALLRTGALGGRAGAVVLDGATGDVLLDQDATTARTPASVAKLATSLAALQTLGPEHRLRTRVASGDTPGEIVLVGAGDATLTVRAPKPSDYPRRASLADLADATAAALRPATAVTVRVDDSLFSGPAVAPDWPASYVASGVVSPVSALSVDGGRVRPGSAARERDPAIAAGEDFVRLLKARGVTVTGTVSRTTSPAAGASLAEVESPTVAELVELDLATSDNDLAEALLRLSALSRGRPGTFAGGTAVVRDVLAESGIPTDGFRLLDGSGLARTSTIAPVTLARLLLTASAAEHPQLRAIVTGLPVAGFSGTLAARFAGPASSSGAGLVRAKTGTLTGVSTLAGVAEGPSGPLVFVIMCDSVRAGATLAARDALDRFTAALVLGGSAETPTRGGG